jgi:hypothetical protein
VGNASSHDRADERGGSAVGANSHYLACLVGYCGKPSTGDLRRAGCTVVGAPRPAGSPDSAADPTYGDDVVDVDDLAAWETRLAAAEADLREREQRALEGDPTREELVAFAAEHEKLASDQDAVADARDAQAGRRDSAGFGRDVRGSQRDRSSREDPGDTGRARLDRIVSGMDRDLAAGDRADSGDDRKRASRARQQAATDRQDARDDAVAAHDKADEQARALAVLLEALESRSVIGQAQGMVMERYNISGDAAFSLLVRLARNTNMTLHDISARMVAELDVATGLRLGCD